MLADGLGKKRRLHIVNQMVSSKGNFGSPERGLSSTTRSVNNGDMALAGDSETL